MTPTLGGRLQTRIFVLVVVGGLWTLVIGLVLPRPAQATQLDVYSSAFQALAIVLGFGLVWELIYHAFQQLRWEKDWPSLFILLTGITEGIVAWYFAVPLGWVLPRVSTTAFVIHYTTTFLVTFFFLHGPMRVLFIRWRFVGGRLL